MKRDFPGIDVKSSSVNLNEQVVSISGDKIDDFFLDCLILRNGKTFPYRFFRPPPIAFSFFSNSTDEGRCIVRGFFVHDEVELSLKIDRMRLTNVGSGSHGGNMGPQAHEIPLRP